MLQHYVELDRRLVAAVKDLKILSALSWNSKVQREFLADWAKGQARPPQVEYAAQDHRERRAELLQIAEAAGDGDAVAHYLANTARSWHTAALMMEAVGTAELSTHAIELYGRPGDAISGGEVNNLEAAHHFIAIADEVIGHDRLNETEYCLSAEIMKSELQAQMDAIFTQHKVRVEVDPNLASKAAAGPTRIRLRAGTCFSEYDLSQLLEHEAFVHSLTALNGRSQTNLGSLGLSSPRTTATQEGLAVFAELVTGSIDIMRMKRISLRILAIEDALNGADFLDVFRLFLGYGQNEVDSFNSTMRVFRGVPTSGGSAFTKDTVYLHGLLSVHTFFRWALRQGRLPVAQDLFAGKMTLHDVVELEPFFDNGFIQAPLYLPPWMRRHNGLAGYLSFSLFANRIRLDQVEREHVVLGV
ncbi:MAG: DUF1704 domain-containing protein [Xanthomonadales bacterium]|nr:DUF1704 domain-containing protein [Xanthomonadales bacterium]